MIYETLQILKEQLDAFFVQADQENVVTLDNIALWDTSGENAANIQDKVVISLLRAEEEAALKNGANHYVNGERVEYKNPPVNLNLYVLISSNFESYEKSLISISRVMQFFQGKKVFTPGNTVYERNNVSMHVLDNFKFVVDMYSAGFEELNNIWSMLGGKQLPSVIYKVQSIQVDRDKKLSVSNTITTVQGNFKDSSL